MFLLLSIGNKIGGDPHILQIQSYMTNATIIFMFFLFQIARKKMRDIQIEADLKLGPQDYAVMFRVPMKYYTEQEV